MKKYLSPFLIIYFTFHVILLLVSVYINYKSEDFNLLITLRQNMSVMVYTTAVGLVLNIINIFISGFNKNNHEKEIQQYTQEINALKAKMFDLQDASTPTKSEDKTASAGIAQNEEKEDLSED